MLLATAQLLSCYHCWLIFYFIDQEQHMGAAVSILKAKNKIYGLVRFTQVRIKIHIKPIFILFIITYKTNIYFIYNYL